MILDILDDLPSERRSLVCKRLFEFLYMYHMEMGVDKCQNLDVLKQICVRAFSACSRVETFEFDHQFNTIKGMYEIYKLYGLESNLVDLSPDGKRKYLTVVLLKEVELVLKGKKTVFPRFLLQVFIIVFRLFKLQSTSGSLQKTGTDLRVNNRRHFN